MRFILSALLTTAIMGTMTAADVRHGQQAAFRLEPRRIHEQQNHHRKADYSHSKSSSMMERRDLHKPALTAPQVPAVKANVPDLALYKKKVHGKKSHGKHQKANHSHHKQSKRALEPHRKNHSHHMKSSSSCKYNKRAIENFELHRKNYANHKKSFSSCSKHIKRAIKNEDTELAFHRKVSRNRKTWNLGQKKKNSKRELFKTQDIKPKKSPHHKQHK
ncbi:hypothetical protein BC939DRAFT_449213 [Gamsiella multidivaricata]|uniref:uncharacterized protein n=1 Tax=Gamsiella multidivaricata TaxID=101098 RepID=UPI002220F8EF|nr:uncharacterized protein BC939DRAFT_449213 [Gamsiella multidivaricata]KAI7824779.1 hypothetical protein BC939DRAFT_449213 [Gamsiella multidivaricata]